MASAVAKPEEKKSKAAEPSSELHEEHGEEYKGIAAGMPLFLLPGKAGAGAEGNRKGAAAQPAAPAKTMQPAAPAAAVGAGKPREQGRPEAAPKPSPAAAARQIAEPGPAAAQTPVKPKGPASAAPTGPSPKDSAKDFMRRETSGVASDPKLHVHHIEGGPTVLVPASNAPAAGPAAKADKTPAPKKPPATKPPERKARPSLAKHGREALRKAEAKNKVGGRHAGRAGGRPQAHAAGPRRAASRRAHGAGAGKLASMVPPPAPEALRAQIPSRPLTFAEFQQQLEQRQGPTELRSQAQTMVAGLRTNAATEKDSVSGDAARKKAAIASDAAAKIAAVHGTGSGTRAALESYFASATAKVQQQGAQKKALLPGAVAADMATATAAGDQAAANAQTEGNQRKTNISAYAEEESRQPATIAAGESSRASGILEDNAQQCQSAGEAEAANYPGEDSPKPKQRRAARQVGTESAADIRAKKSDIADDMQSRADGIAAKYMPYANVVIKQIDEALGQLIPALHQAAADTAGSVSHTAEATIHGIDDRVHVDLQALGVARTQSLAQLEHAEHSTVEQLQDQAQRMQDHIDEGAAAIETGIDHSVEETAQVVSGPEVPFIPGVRDIMDGGRLKVRAVAETGRKQLSQMETSARESLASTQTAFGAISGQLLGVAHSTAAGIASRNATALDKVLDARSKQVAAMIANLRSRNQETTQGVMAEVDRAIEKARGEIRGITDKFRTESRKAADESIQKAIQPRTDTVEERAAKAANKAGESWAWGLLRALGDIVVGLVVLVVVALVVAAIAALFGVILTAWTAVMIAGALLLAVGLIMAYIHRSGQKELQGHPFEIIGLTFADATGVTGIIQAFSGHDIVTGDKLSDADRTEQGVVGAVTLIGLIFGARSAIKGPPGGVYLRPGTFEWPGFGEFFKSGWRDYLPAAKEAVKSVASELYNGLRTGVKNVVDWIKQRFGKAEQPPQQQPPPPPQQQRQQPQQPQQPPAPRPAYDPTVLTMDQLRADVDPTPRPGETPAEAQQRSAAAQDEILRRQVAIETGLGETPREVDIAAEDAAGRGPGAHTMERHAASIQLEMPRDAAGNRMPVPTGVKSIEGRIFGDTDWAGPEQNSSRWLSDDIMNRTVNDYIRQNWTRIRADLATTGRHANAFQAPPGAVGEGYYNPNQGLPGGAANRQAFYIRTNLVRIVINLIPGPPPDFYVSTAFPNPLGAPAH